ncbi:GTP pyrophosphokinase family protein [Patescibacteria group bacterium]
MKSLKSNLLYMAENSKKLLKDYNEKITQYNEFLNFATDYIKSCLDKEGFSSVLIHSRIKTKKNFTSKINRPESKYAEFEEITDIAGIRIISYFENQIDNIAKVIEKYFVIDSVNSDNIKYRYDYKSFGYLSLHYICQLPNKIVKKGNNQKFVNLKIEIQIRSLLQHAWAEIEHDLGYKSKVGVPMIIKRRFARLASILELADQEFNEISNVVKNYEKLVFNDPVRKQKGLLLDKLSIESYITDSELVDSIDKKIAKKLSNSILQRDLIDVTYIIKMFSYLDIITIIEIDKRLRALKNRIIDFTEIYVKYLSITRRSKKIELTVSKGYCLFFLGYLLLLERKETDLQKIHNLSKFFITYDNFDENEAKRKARAMVDLFKKCS